MFHTKTKKTVIIAEILIAVNNYVRVNYLSVLVHLFCNESHKLFQSIWDGRFIYINSNKIQNTEIILIRKLIIKNRLSIFRIGFSKWFLYERFSKEKKY